MFAFRLAKTLGMTVGEVLCRMSAREFREWLAYDSIEPIDSDRRMELAAGVNAALHYNMNRRQGSPAMTPRQFMPNWDGSDAKQQSPQEMLEIARSLAASGLGVITSGGRHGDNKNTEHPDAAPDLAV